MQKLESLEESRGRKEIRQFYENVKDGKQGFQSKTIFCEDKDWNLIWDQQGILRSL